MSVGPGSAGAVTHAQVVVRAEEAVEPTLLGGVGDGQLLLVAGALLGLDEDAQFHAAEV